MTEPRQQPSHEPIEEAAGRFGVTHELAHAILMGEEPPPGTLAEASRDLSDAAGGCALSLAYALKLDRLADFLSRALRRISR